jgi:hypothetical protein
MGNSSNKLKCLYFPAQSGKTQRVKSRIDFFEALECFGDEGYINFLISSNNILLVEQTSKRFDSPFDWTSVQKKIQIKKLAWDILEETYNMVVMCANRVRLNHFEKLIEVLESSKHFNKKINIWIDEADANISLWNSYNSIISKDIVNSVTLVSATFDSVFKKYGRLNVIGSKETYPDCYRCLKDSIINRIDFVGKPEDYIIHVLDKFPDLAKPGMRGFIPGGYFKSSHDTIANVLVKDYNFVVLIINGDRKEFLIPDKDPIDISEYFSSSDELKDILARIYLENEFYKYPFAITGLECVKRGITFQSNQFIFDYGIVPSITKKVEAYQLMARLFGNIGDFSIYKPCAIYSTSNNFNKIQKQESMAINIAKMVEEQLLDTVGSEELRQAINLGDIDKCHNLFDTQEEAIEFAKSLGKTLKKRYNNLAPEELLNQGVNPTVTDLVTRMWGLNNRIPLRMVPTDENKWCIYWRPSLL